jgi:hypothetical protein
LISDNIFIFLDEFVSFEIIKHEELRLVLDNLKRDKLIKKDEDVIRDYLAVLPAILAAMEHGERRLAKMDRKYWVNDTIQWIIKPVCKLSNSSHTSLTPRNRAKGP